MKRISFFIILFLTIFLSSCANNGQSYGSQERITWLDANGSKLATTYCNYGELPNYSLPEDTDAWDYTGWDPEIETAYSATTYTAIRNLKKSYFAGNVFQIAVFNLGNILIGTGSGFVFNEQGWFITNYHVMEDAYFAQAIFDIPDISISESFTRLNIEEASYKNVDKDIFIGKISNYSKVSLYYQDFELATTHEMAEKTYSIGYPNSSIVLEIHEGFVENDLSSIYDKVYSGISYIGSTSYIAPGSSGGILINSNLEILGMTTVGITDSGGDFELGGAIDVYNYKSLVNEVKTIDLKNLALLLHPTEKVFIGYYKEAMEHSKDPEKNCVKIENEDFTRYTYTEDNESVTDDGVNLTYNSEFSIDSDGYINHEDTYYWANGQRRVIRFYGFYSHTEGLKNFNYEFEYTWDDGTYYSLKSTNINYSTNLNLTLNQYTTMSSYSYTIGTYDIEYAKQHFNILYEWLTEDMARFE